MADKKSVMGAEIMDWFLPLYSFTSLDQVIGMKKFEIITLLKSDPAEGLVGKRNCSATL